MQQWGDFNVMLNGQEINSADCFLHGHFGGWVIVNDFAVHRAICHRVSHGINRLDGIRALRQIVNLK